MPNMMSWPGANFGKGIFETALGYETGGATGALLAATAASGVLAPKMPTVNVPPPPGAAMIDPTGQAAAAAQRRSAAAAGGLQSTISPGASTATGGGATSGSKSALGQ